MSFNFEKAYKENDIGVVGQGVVEPEFNYQTAHLPDTPNDPEATGFYPKEGFFKTIEDYMAGRPNSHILVSGSSGVGKTTFFNKIIQSLWERENLAPIVLGLNLSKL